MSSLITYLKQYYCTTEQMASACMMSVAEFQDLLSAELVPRASYWITVGGEAYSRVFGQLDTHGERLQDHADEYFHRLGIQWVQRAQAALRASNVEQARRRLLLQFSMRFASALQQLDRSMFRLIDCFNADGDIIADGLQARIESNFNHLMCGVFNLCVADPSDEANIARKEILQEALSTLSDQGRRSHYSAQECSQLKEFVAQYAHAAMPFAPQEYPRSSRKRLVEDLSQTLNAS